jgi:Tfp pilus assembly protein PilO
MIADWRPWQRLLPVWLPTVILCVLAAAAYAWQTSETGGRSALVKNSVNDLEQEIARLEGIRDQAGQERAEVAEINEQFEHLYGQVFGDLDERLTRILREVGSATRSAGLMPSRYGYSAEEDRKHQYIRFTIQYSVIGDYSQIRQMLAALQSSPEFLIVEDIAFSGEEEATSQNLAISVQVATYVAKADPETLRRLTGGITKSPEATDGKVES